MKALLLAVHCGRLINGVAEEPLRDATVLIEGERIVSVGHQPVPAGATLLDLSAYTCLPGLIDLHTHLTDDPKSNADPAKLKARTLAGALPIGRRGAAATLQAGFTTVRDVGAYVAFANVALKREIDSGQTPGPRMQAAPFYLTIPGGGGDIVGPGEPTAGLSASLRMGVARGTGEFAAKAATAIRGGGDLVKLIVSGAVLAVGGVPGASEMTYDEVKAAVNVAHAAGRKVAAHAHGAAAIKDALRAGADTVEHASLIDDEGLALARLKGAVLVMDVYDGDYIDEQGRQNGMPEEYLEKNLATLHRQREAFARAVRAGVPLAFGTDASTYPHGHNGRQFRIMTALGMPQMQAIQSATRTAARAMGWEDRVGTLEPGRYADLVAVPGDPLLDISHLENIPVVLQGGRVVKGPVPTAPGSGR